MKLEHGKGNNMKLKKVVHHKSTQTSVYFWQKKLRKKIETLEILRFEQRSKSTT